MFAPTLGSVPLEPPHDGPGLESLLHLWTIFGGGQSIPLRAEVLGVRVLGAVSHSDAVDVLHWVTSRASRSPSSSV
jgi:hypothetical protein